MQNHRPAYLVLVLAIGLSALALQTVVAGPAAKPPTVATFNLSRVFAESPQMKKLTAEVEALYGPRLRSLEARQKELEKEMQALLQDAGMPRNQKAAEQRRLLGEVKKVRDDVTATNQAADARKLDFLQRYEVRIRRVVEEVGKAEGIDLVLSTTDLESGRATGAAMLAKAVASRTIWYTSGSVVDLTDRLLERLGSE